MLTNERAPVCRLLAAADYYYILSFGFTHVRRPWRTLRTWLALTRPIRLVQLIISESLFDNSGCATTCTSLANPTLKNSFVLFAVVTATKTEPGALPLPVGQNLLPLYAEVAANVSASRRCEPPTSNDRYALVASNGANSMTAGVRFELSLSVVDLHQLCLSWPTILDCPSLTRTARQTYFQMCERRLAFC